MPDSLDKVWGTVPSPSNGGAALAADAGPRVPTPPSEVKIRTMASDIASLGASGGIGPSPEKVELSLDGASPAAPAGGSRTYLIALLAVIVIAAILFGYYILFAVFGKQSKTSYIAPATANLIESSGLARAPSDARGFFASAPAATLPLAAEAAPASTARALMTYRQKALSILDQEDVNLVEIIPTDAGGAELKAQDLFGALGAPVFPPEFFESVSPVYAYVAYRDARGWWPTYVFSLAPSSNWLFMKPIAARIESSPQADNLFLTLPGEVSGGFADAPLAEGGMWRREPFGGPAGAALWYGWFHDYFLVSTNDGALRAVVDRLKI